MNGKMGIGTVNPQSQLDVNGTIRAKEVKIGSTGWADFVFTPEYKLPPLSEVENHILEHGHLPSIPSAKEVQENGVDVGELQVKLLLKIEELTLYTIQQQKQIEIQDKQIQELLLLIKTK